MNIIKRNIVLFYFFLLFLSLIKCISQNNTQKSFKKKLLRVINKHKSDFCIVLQISALCYGAYKKIDFFKERNTLNIVSSLTTGIWTYILYTVLLKKNNKEPSIPNTKGNPL